MYSIGEFSKKTGITIRTLRYYGEKGLLKPARISEGGQRYYNDANIITVQKIVTFKYLDYSLEEIKELLKKDDSLLQSLEHQKLQLLKKKKQWNKCLQRLIRLFISIREIWPLILLHYCSLFTVY